jgi:allantoinase
VAERALNITAPDGTAAAAPGYDHGWYSWSARPARPGPSWPGGARVAVSVVLDVRAAEWERPGLTPPVRPPGGRGLGEYPDVPRLSHREFGHRVGVFRLLALLRDLGIAPAVAVDVLTAEHYGALVDRLRPAAAEFLAGGLSASRPLTSAMTADEESHYIRATLDRLEAALGTRPAGWLSPEHSESARTPELLAAAGLRYVADWGNDERPYPMPGAGPDLWAFPLSWELSDVAAMYAREVSPPRYGRSLTEAFDVLCDDGPGRVLALHLHPWLSGQAFRADAIADALAYLRGSGRAWFATPLDIVAWTQAEGDR